MAAPFPEPLRLARHAMATRFELALHGADPVALRAAGEEALDEIERLEDQLSLFRPASDIAHANARAAREPVRVSPAVFGLLQHARRLSDETGGAFDITIGPLMQCWGLLGETGRVPGAEEVAAARTKMGMHLVTLDERDLTVGFAREGVMLDLGAIGKGFALQRAAELLRDAGVASALLHGGTSTVCALGAPPGAGAWKVAIECPPDQAPLAPQADADATRGCAPQGAVGFPPSPLPAGVAAVDGPRAHDDRRAPSGSPMSASDRTVVHGRYFECDSDGPRPVCLAVVPLRDEALSVSAFWGKSFRVGGRTFGHVLDPRTGWPTSAAALAAVVTPSATDADALSTALLTLGAGGLEAVMKLRPGSRALVLTPRAGPTPARVRAFGIPLVSDSP
jgi:thiamine biosynthesis lipoprotein ApbE